ncbi:MAG TPA: hypothetical protein VHZ51_10105 [Ktedonobacteraceae bacterium]|nr:hypothetical protein [Ktedonobacteraceae bacterium]
MAPTRTRKQRATPTSETPTRRSRRTPTFLLELPFEVGAGQASRLHAQMARRPPVL